MTTAASTPTPIPYPITFNGTDLSTVSGLQVYSINPYGAGRNLLISQIARRSVRKLSSAFYNQRQIYVSLYIAVPSRALLDQSLDQLLSIIQTQEAALIINQSGALRQYTASYSTQTINNDSPNQSSVSAPLGGFIDLTLTFECSDSFGYDPTPTLLANQYPNTLYNPSVTFIQTGTADTQVPIVTITFTGSGSNTGSVTIGNQKTGQAITVTTTFNQYDALVIDCQHKTVQINGVDVNFSGAFPDVGLGQQTLYYVDTFTTRTFTFLVNVFNRYI